MSCSLLLSRARCLRCRVRMVVTRRRLLLRVVRVRALDYLVDFREALEVAPRLGVILRVARRIQAVEDATDLFIVRITGLLHMVEECIQVALKLPEFVPKSLFFIFLLDFSGAAFLGLELLLAGCSSTLG